MRWLVLGISRRQHGRRVYSIETAPMLREIVEVQVGESGDGVMEEDATSSWFQSPPYTPDIRRLKRVIMVPVDDYIRRPTGCSLHHWRLMSIEPERCGITLNIVVLQMKTELGSMAPGMHACDLSQMPFEKSWYYWKVLVLLIWTRFALGSPSCKARSILSRPVRVNIVHAV